MALGVYLDREALEIVFQKRDSASREAPKL